MLVITRRNLENFMIGDEVVIKILGVKGNQVRIGIDAPREVEVHREEIYKKIQAEKLERILNDTDEVDEIDRQLKRSIYRKYKKSANDAVIPKEIINY